MTEPSHYSQILSTLLNGWGTYVARFRHLSAAEQAAFLERQGYARLADLLAHVAAWWGDGLERMKLLRADPDLPPRENPQGVPSGYDVDSFNARAVEGVRHLEESDVIALFDSRREALLAFVRGLAPGELERNPALSKRLHVEVISHLREHEISRQ